MTVKKFYFIISILLVSVLLVNCSNETEQAAEPGLLLGFSQIGTESAWRIGNTRDIEEAAENLTRIRDEIVKDGGKLPSALIVLCGLSNAAYRRPDGVCVVPLTALKN